MSFHLRLWRLILINGFSSMWLTSVYVSLSDSLGSEDTLESNKNSKREKMWKIILIFYSFSLQILSSKRLIYLWILLIEPVIEVGIST